MNPITAFLHKISRYFRDEAQGPAAPDISFAECYRAFRTLLTANNHALELMAGMEQQLLAGRPFGMAFVRGNCTALSVNVFKMIRALQQMGGERYKGLDPPFTAITGQLQEILAHRPVVPDGPLILPMDQVDRRAIDLAGEKMANLGEIRNRAGLRTPDGFVITSAATEHFMRESNLLDEINRRLKTMDEDDLEELYRTSSAIQQLIIKAPLPVDLEQAIMSHYRQLRQAAGDSELLVSMRSSAIGEDSGSASFAGQYRTQLNVGEEFLIPTYKEIVAGKYRSQAIVYRLQRGFRHQDVAMCVGCLAMVDAVISGVTYSRSPTDRRSDFIEINCVAGLASQVVDGNVIADYYRIGRAAPHPVLLQKTGAGHARPKGSACPALGAGQINELAVTALRLEEYFGEPQDIEWSFDRSGRLIILQSRPLGLAPALDSAEPAAAAGGGDHLLAGGVTAARGTASGPVFIVRSNVDLLLFPKDAVLVVAHPVPEWATLLNRAAAVISETGQVAAHLATVAREFGVPALFGVSNATSALANGQIITVDATGCRVYAGRRQDLLDLASQPQPNLMLGSPIHKLLQQAMTLISPLNLTDPASIYFKPSSCRTLHDLTRYCHEKAVTEMFSFGSRHGFDEKTAKQLVGEMPYQWWVIDLDDGFAADFNKKEKYIPITAIVSRPMLAIWAGMTAIAWEGPPPVSLSGFGSIIFQSTKNRNLDPALRSNLTARNYFLVSRNFCNVSVRLGYHFSLVESHVSEFLTENYASFQFKGGAADEWRKMLRVNLIRDILAAYDFRVEQKADTLSARIEKKPAEYLLDRLKVIGYLLIHTRQIDMVMGDSGMVEHYRRKIMTELNEIVLPQQIGPAGGGPAQSLPEVS
jgi:pyruvate,water dikinase